MSDNYSSEMEGSFLPEIKFIESDYEPIPGSNCIHLDKSLSPKAVTVWARYWKRQGIRADIIGTSHYPDIFKSAEELGLSREFIASRLKAADFSRKLNDAAAKFQKLLDKQELQDDYAITGTVTIPNDTDAVLFHTCELNRAEQESNTN